MSLGCYCGTLTGCPIHCPDCGREKDTPITYTFCARCTERRETAHQTAHQDGENGSS